MRKHLDPNPKGGATSRVPRSTVQLGEEAVVSRKVLDDRTKLSLLFAVSRARGQCTQRDVADALAIPKVEARRHLREAVAEGLIDEAVDDSPAAPGRKLFTISEQGIPELDRLRKTVWRAS